MINKDSKKALAIQEKIEKHIDELEKLGYEFMFHNSITSIRALRTMKEPEESVKSNPHDTQEYDNGSGGYE
tara:strand:+ start:484 stop:696 length:213 start_codon:yes stop_codon:yes gene_type:complete